MPFNPALPADDVPVEADVLRAQFTGLHALIPAAAQVDSVSTGSAGSAAQALASLSGGVLHLDFTIPQGAEGQQGPTGEVSQSQLSNDLVNTQNAAVNTAMGLSSANSNGVSLLGVSSGDFTVQTLIDKMNELINALRR